MLTYGGVLLGAAEAGKNPKAVAKERYDQVVALNGELLVSGSEVIQGCIFFGTAAPFAKPARWHRT